MIQQKNILHIAIIGGLLTSFGASLDAWWHISFDRDSFFILPHLFIYTGVFILLASSFWAWRRQARAAWKKIFLVLLIIPLSLPFDELWHYFRGKETVSSIFIIWSPPHALLFLSAITALGMITGMISKEKNMAAKEIFGAVLLASLFNLLVILTSPFFPLSPFAVTGFYGAAVTAFIMSWIFFYARRILPHVTPALLVAAFSIILQGVIADSAVVYGSRAVGSFSYLPSWIFVLFQIIPAAIIDTTFIKNLAIRGLFAGIAGGLVMYVLSLQFTDPLFHYSAATAATGVIFAGLGSALGGYMHSQKT